MTTYRGFYTPHERVSFDNIDPKTKKPYPSMTKQEFKDECDINNILKQYSQTGMLTHINAQAAEGRYEDLPEPNEFQYAMNLVIDAQASFDSLPAKIRDRFGNDPAAFFEFCHNPDNREEAIKLGVLKPPPPLPPQTGGDGGTPPSGGSEATGGS